MDEIMERVTLKVVFKEEKSVSYYMFYKEDLKLYN